MKIIKKFLSIILLISILSSNFINVFAVSIFESEKVNLIFDHDCVSVLKIKGKDSLKHVPYICYIDPDTGIKYPAFCVEPTKNGIGTGAGYSYDVTLTELSNPILWRMLYRGYVGTSYTDWNLECDDDLYFATKTAVHCFVDGSTPTSKYEIPHRVGIGDNATLEDVQRRGEKVLQVAQAIYDYAYTSTDDYIKAVVEITKKGDLYQTTINNINYLIQDYYVTSNKELSSYNINISNFPNGTKILNSSNNDSNIMSNPNFKIAIPINTINENFTGNINITNAKVKSYPIFYADSGNSATQNYIIADSSEITSAYTTLDIDAYTSTLKIIKTDTESNAPISGVVFNVKYSDGTNIGDYTTDVNGIITINKLKQGNIIVSEISTPNNYILDNSPKNINLEYNSYKTLSITNDKKKGNIKIIKFDTDNNEIRLSNVEFKLFNENQKEIGTYITNENGEIYINNLDIGKYTIKEIKTNAGYNLTNDVNFIIDYNQTTTLEIDNEKSKGQIKIIKIDKDDNTIFIPNTKFEILDENKKHIETIVTNENGEAFSSELPSYNRFYYIREIEANENYQLPNNEFKVEITTDKITELIIENEIKKGKIQIEKIDKDDPNIKIEGVIFNIINDRTNEIVDTITTDKNGIATTIDLNIFDTYTAIEIKTNEKYELNNENIQNIKLQDNNITKIKVTNEKKKGKVHIVKVDKDNHDILLENVVFEVLDKDMNYIETLITNKKGEATSSLLPSIGETYYLREIKTSELYQISTDLKTIILKDNDILNIIFENQKIKGYLEITKVDSNDENIKLKDAVFGIYNENSELIQTLKTDQNGKAVSNLLIKGNYYLRELDTGSSNYLLNTNTFEFRIINNNEIVPITVKNEPVNIKVNVNINGDIETKPNEIVNYSFSNIANESNNYLDNFKWFNYLPTDSVRIQQITTGTWNQELLYKIYYKTNKTNEYILYKANLNTKENYEINFLNLELEDSEFITEFYFDFGKVDINFKEEISPTLTCRTLETLENNSTFINYTKTLGNYNGIETEANSNWTTIVYIPKKPESVLPRTGK